MEGLAAKLKMPMKSASVKGPKSMDEELDLEFGSPEDGAESGDVLLSEATPEQLEAALAAAKAKAAPAGEEGDADEAVVEDEEDDDMYA